VRSWSEKKVFTAHARSLRAAAERIIGLIPEPVPGQPEWRCHELARSVGRRFRLEVVDGKFGGVDHSWLVIPEGRLDRGAAILDVYAVGALPMVRLVAFDSPEATLFEPGPERVDVRWCDLAAIDHVLDPCDHPDGFDGRTSAGEAFCARCGEVWAR
jgi:hypothetical protein